MAASENRSPGAARNKTGAGVGRAAQQNLADDGSQRASFGERRDCFSSSFAFFFSCVVSRLDGSARTLLLTQTLRESFNSSLNMAPVIEPSDEGRGGGRGTG